MSNKEARYVTCLTYICYTFFDIHLTIYRLFIVNCFVKKLFLFNLSKEKTPKFHNTLLKDED